MGQHASLTQRWTRRKRVLSRLPNSRHEYYDFEDGQLVDEKGQKVYYFENKDPNQVYEVTCGGEYQLPEIPTKSIESYKISIGSMEDDI